MNAEIWISHILRWGVIACAGVILSGWLATNPQLINLGLILLICLPIARVFAAGVIFFRQKDFIFVGFSLFVLVVLLASLMLGKMI
jgi:uncharacterized membrane protein